MMVHCHKLSRRLIHLPFLSGSVLLIVIWLDWYLRWKEKKSGFNKKTQVDDTATLLSLLVGFEPQHFKIIFKFICRLRLSTTRLWLKSIWIIYSHKSCIARIRNDPTQHQTWLINFCLINHFCNVYSSERSRSELKSNRNTSKDEAKTLSSSTSFYEARARPLKYFNKFINIFVPASWFRLCALLKQSVVFNHCQNDRGTHIGWCLCKWWCGVFICFLFLLKFHSRWAKEITNFSKNVSSETFGETKKMFSRVKPNTFISLTPFG